MRICLVAFHFPILGRANDQGFLWPIARGLAARGHSVTVISAKSRLGKQEIVRDGVRVFYLHEGFPNRAHIPFPEAAFEKFLELHRANPFDVVHSIDSSGIKIGSLKKELGFVIAFDVEATQMSQILSILGMGQENLGSLLQTSIAVTYKFLTTFFAHDRKLLRMADGIFVTSPLQKIFLERYYLYPEFLTYLVPYGIELGNLAPRSNNNEIRQKLNLDEGKNIVLTVSDMTEAQEIKYLLSAFERVAVKKPDVLMIIVGNGPAWKEIEYHLYSLALGSRVLMTGAKTAEEISEYIAVSDIFLNMSARSTGFEPSMIEAMAQGKVIVGSEVSPMSHIIEDGVDGFLLRPADVESLAHLLIEIFSGGMPSVDIGARAQEKVLKMFDSKRMISAIEDSYAKILAKGKNRLKARPIPSRPPEANP